MGVDGSKLSFRQKQEQTEVLMQQNAEIAKRLSQEYAAHKKKPGTMINQIGKNIFEHMKFKNNDSANRNQIKLIEVEGVTYEIIDFISQGGFGEVYRARTRNKNRVVAIKIMKNMPDIREEIQNEINFLRLIKKVPIENHPIINYYGSQFTKENIHIAMELASCDLVAFWSAHMTHLDPENRFLLGITVIVYVLRALTFLEQLNIIHGDIKPQNFVIVSHNDSFYVKLIDFGTVEKMDTSRAQITVDATKAHTIFFASPEFLRRDSNHVIARHLHKKSDAWAAGVMFYILFFERLPWTDQFDYENFCNDPSAKDIFVPRKGGYKLIIELLLKKNPDERASAKATLKQMIAHPALCDIIKSLNDSLCLVDDTCRMKVPNDVRKEIAKLSRPGHFVHRSDPSVAKKRSGSRRSCKFGADCNRDDTNHHEEFAHIGDADYHESRSASNSQFDKPACRYGSDCFRKDADHLNKYAHPANSTPHTMSANSHGQSTKPHCRYGVACYNTEPEHLKQYAHPNNSNRFAIGVNNHVQSTKRQCRFGESCYDQAVDHRLRFAHPTGSTDPHCKKVACQFGSRCNKTGDPAHMTKFQH
ncbi:unnamed protein product [Rotaria socialis]|uniref:Protein kinase domain-containing protein n=1 Tax=Rotaria socialis TaxID=392032 RepID=A0A817U9S9_9BILA|nr:unnamed protein product [Rotaria socialis]CAF3328456.1 unnamed protein product [Rotaria socialis]